MTGIVAASIAPPRRCGAGCVDGEGKPVVIAAVSDEIDQSSKPLPAVTWRHECGWARTVTLQAALAETVEIEAGAK